MDEKQLQFLFDNYAKGRGFKDIGEFRSLMEDEGSRKVFFDDSNKELGFKDYNDFEETIGVKKKPLSNAVATPLEVGSPVAENGLSSTPNPEIPIVDITDPEKFDNVDNIDLVNQYGELKNKTKEVEGLGDRGSMQVVPDEDARKKADKLSNYLKGQGIEDTDELYDEIKGLTPNDFGKEGFSKEELLQDRKENREVYTRKIGRLKWQTPLENILAESLVNENLDKAGYDNINNIISSSLTALNNRTGDFDQQRRRVNDVANVIKNFGGDKTDELLKNFAVEVSKVYGNSYKTGGVKVEAGTPESKYLTDTNEELGYQYLKDVAPEKAQQYERLFIDPKSIKNDPDAMRGYNHLKQTLAETGINLQQNAVNEDFKKLQSIAQKNGGLSPEQIKEAEDLERKMDELAKAKQELDTKYPERREDKVNDALDEIFGQRVTGLNYGGAKAGEAVKNTVQGVWEAVSSPFMDDNSNTMRELAIMGEKQVDENVLRKTDKNKNYLTDHLVIEPELQVQIDAIKNDKNLTQDKKELKTYSLLRENTDKFGRVPIQGGKFNINPSSVLYGVTDIGASLLPFIAIEAGTGGIGGAGMAANFLRTFSAAAATTFHDEYAGAISEGKRDFEAYKMAMINTAIGSAAMAGAGTAGKVRAMVGGNTSAGTLIKNMSDEAIEKVLAKGTPKGLKGFGNAVKERLKATPKMLLKGAETGAEFEAAMTGANELKSLVNNTPIDREQNFNQSLLQIGNFTFLGLLGHVGYKKPTDLQKSTILNFGSKPEEFHAALEKMKGELSPTEYEHRKDLIDRSAEAIKVLPKSNSKGKPLSQKEAGDYLYNTVIRNEANKAKSTLPQKQAEKAEHTAMVADAKMDIIVEQPTDIQLEKQQSTIEKKLEPKVDAEGKAEVLPEKEKAALKAELEAVKETIEERKYVTVEPPMNIPEPITIGGEKNKSNETIKEPVEGDKSIATEAPVIAEAEPTTGGGSTTPPKEETVTSGVYQEPMRTTFSHRGLQEVATEFGLNDITSRERVGDLELFRRVDETIGKWTKDGSYKKNVDEILQRGKEKKPVSDEENLILAQHIAQLREQGKQARKKFGLNSPEYDAKVKELNDVVKVGETIRSQQGAALRVPILSRAYLPSLEDAMAAKMAANGTDVLTETQKAQVEKDFEKIQKERDEAVVNWQAAEAKFVELQAQNELLKKQKTGTSKSDKVIVNGKRDYKAERKNYKDDLKKLVEEYKSAGQKLGVAADGGAESFVISAKMAKAIMKIVGSHLEETGAKLGEVTKRTFDDIKDLFEGITEKDVHEIIAGKYTERVTRSELAAQLYEIRTEAKLLDEYNRLVNKEPKTEKEKKAKNERLTELREKIKELQKEQGEGQYSDKQKAERAISANKKREEKIRERIANKDFDEKPKPTSFIESEQFKKEYPDLYKKALDSYIAKQDAQHDFDVALLKDSQDKRYRIVPGKNKLGTIVSGGKVLKNRVIDFAGAAANTTKKVVTGIDDSSLFMQTLAAMASHPIIAARAVKMHALDAFSKKRFERNLAELHNAPDWPLMQKAGLDVTEPKSLSELNKEEAFSGKTLDVEIGINGKKHKILQTVLSPFERAFTSLGNGMRVIAFRSIAEKFMSEGKTFETDPKLYKDLALMLNTETGRGKQNEYVQKASELVTKGIWSPRLMASRLNMLGISDAASILFYKAGTKGYYNQLHPEIRKQAIKDLVSFSTTVLALSYLAAWKFGGTVDTDPTSQTYLDIKFPNGKSYNISGGFAQYIRTVAQTVKGGKTKNGVFEELGGWQDRGSNVLHFGRGKVTPIAGVGIDLLTGKDFAGKPVTISGEAQKLSIPLSLQNVASDIKKDGLEALYSSTLPSFVGITVKDERDFTSHKFSPEVDKFIEENQVAIKMPNKTYVKEGEEMEMTDAEYKSYLTKLDERIEHDIEQIKKNGLTNGKTDQESIKKAVKEAISIATQMTKFEMFGDQQKKPTEPVFINNYEPLPIEN